MTSSSAGRLALAQAAVWLIWGSTYYGVRVLVQEVPPFFGMGSRFMAAGLAVLVFLWFRGAALPTRQEWLGAAIGGLMMVAAGNGAVAWTEQTVPSNLVALTVALMPAWMVLFDRLLNGVVAPPSTLVALVVGFAGVAVLLGPQDLLGDGEIPLWGAALVSAGSISWAYGSILTRDVPKPPTMLMGTAAQMMWGGAGLLVLSILVGEPSHLRPDMLSAGNVGVWLYLVIAGSIIAYSAYVYLLHHTTPAKAGSYAFVNPVIAVFVGWGLGGEPLNGRVGLAAILIVAAVALIVRQQSTPDEN